MVDAKLDSLQDLIRIPPFHRWLDVQLVHAEPGRVVLRVPYKEDLIGNPLIPAWHGGITAALVDLAGGAALFAALGIPTPTIDMRIDYVRPALADQDLLCDARADSIGRTIGYVDAVAFQLPGDVAWSEDVEDERLVARGRCVYSTKEQGRSTTPDDVPIG